MNPGYKTFFQIFSKKFSHELIWTFEDFEEKRRKTAKFDCHHGLAWIGMVYHIVSRSIQIKMRKPRNARNVGIFRVSSLFSLLKYCIFLQN